MKLFEENLQTILQHNAAYQNGSHTFRMGINQFTDMTFKEFSRLNEVNESNAKIPDDIPYDPLPFEIMENIKVPLSFDWRKRGIVTEIMDQKTCGSCYAITIIDLIENHILIKYGKVIRLSTQEIIDCPRNYQLFGCEGGIKHRVFDYIKDRGGISSATDYPYETFVGTCRSSQFEKIPIVIKDFVEVPANDEELLKQVLATIGPVAVSMDINHESFMRYSSGIYYEKNCTKETNHAALLIGYGSENGKDFWIIKSSYGVKYGERGYMRIIRNRDNHCGIASESYYPLVDLP